jgi:peptide/nickel transport system permease protein
MTTESPRRDNLRPDNSKPIMVRAKTVFGLIRRSKGMILGMVIVVAFLAIALAIYLAGLFGIILTPYDPIRYQTAQLAPPSLQHLFGTDVLGRDVFSRVLAATPTDMGVSLAVITVAFIVGGTIGAYAAFNGGLLDEALMRFTDVFFALPGLVLAMVIAVILGPGIINMMFVLMIIWWPVYARLSRGETLKVIHHNFIEAARLSGLGRLRILVRHVLPNIFFILLVYATLDVGTVVLVFAGLSYLGLAVTPPAPDWGQMVNSSQDFLLSAPWLPLFPGLMIALGVIGFSVLGDGLRDVLELR